MDRIDPALVLTRQLRSGATMPAIGLGTFGSDHVNHRAVAQAVHLGLELGYRHIDCAAVYGNEAEIGQVLAATSIGRDQLWISSKVWNDRHDDVVASCEQTLSDLQLDCLDMYLVHWPFPNTHSPHADVGERTAGAVPFRAERYLETWSQMESLVSRGLVRHIGTSNMTMPKFDAVLREMTILPAVNQMELHPHFQQPDFVHYLQGHSIEPVGFCPLGSPNRPERDRTDADTSPTDDPVIARIAEEHGVHPATICLQWAISNGHTPIPFSTSRSNLSANLAAAAATPLSSTDMADLEAVDKNCRLIKGQVFLWKADQPWNDLWDEDGMIVS